VGRSLYYATAEGGFWSFSRENFCTFLRGYQHGTATPTAYGRELRHPPRGVMGCTRGGSSHCVSARNNVVLVRLYEPADIEAALEKTCSSSSLGGCGRGLRRKLGRVVRWQS
jgi:hypothetical protein